MNRKLPNKCQTKNEIEKEDFDFFYAKHSAAVFGWILQWVEDKNVAEHILILTFCKMWKMRKTFEDEDNVKAFFYIPFIIQAGKDFYEERNIKYSIINKGSLKMKFVTENAVEETIL